MPLLIMMSQALPVGRQRASCSRLFITGFAAVTLKASREQPHAKVLSKPFHLRDLVLEVERVLEDRISARLQ